MQEPGLPNQFTSEQQKACDAINRILGPESAITPEQLFRTFGSVEKVAMLSQRGLSKQQIINAIAREAENAPAHPDLSASEIIANGITAFWKWAKIGFGAVNPEQYATRLSACDVCPNQREAPSTGLYKLGGAMTKSHKICFLCGCLLEKKAKLPSEKCPARHPENTGFSRWNEAF